MPSEDHENQYLGMYLAAGISHEMKNALCGIMGYATLLLRDGDLTPQCMKDAEGILKLCRSAAMRTEQFLCYSMVREGKLSLKDFDMYILFDDALEDVGSKGYRTNAGRASNGSGMAPLRIFHRGEAYDPKKKKGVVIVHADSLVTRIAVRNLFDNSFRYAESCIEFDMETKDGAVTCTIGNDCKRDISPEFVRDIFDENPRLPNMERGHGLGLQISKRLIEAQGGRVWAETRKGKDIELYFTLPAGQEAAE